jgi:hypothetical protein
MPLKRCMHHFDRFPKGTGTRSEEHHIFSITPHNAPHPTNITMWHFVWYSAHAEIPLQCTMLNMINTRISDAHRVMPE